MRIRRVLHAHVQLRAAEEILDPQQYILRHVALDFSRPPRCCRASRLVRQIAIISPPASGIAQGFVRRVQLLRPSYRLLRATVQIGVVLLGKEPVSRADLRRRAATIETENGVVIRGGVRQGGERSPARPEGQPDESPACANFTASPPRAAPDR